MTLSATTPSRQRYWVALAGLLAALAAAATAPAVLAAGDSPAPAASAALAATAAVVAPAPALRAEHVLRFAFPVAETGFDPAKISDLYSRIITGQIFEALFHYDHLARPARVRPLTAAAAPDGRSGPAPRRSAR